MTYSEFINFIESKVTFSVFFERESQEAVWILLLQGNRSITTRYASDSLT